MNEQDLKSRIDEIVEADKDSIISDMQQILKYRTVSGADDKAGQDLYISEIANCMEFLKDKSAQMGLEWTNHDNIVAFSHLGDDERFVGLPVHIDVVPVGDGWSQDPFAGNIVDGVIYGRGCQDDKGPVVQMYYAVNTLKKLGVPLGRGARIIVGTTEEHGEWYDIKKYFELEKAPEISIVPDAAFPIINGEKGIINLVVKATLPGDETEDGEGLRFKKAQSGDRANIVPPKAMLVFEGDGDADQLKRELDRFLESHPEAKAEFRQNAQEKTIVFHGKGAHGSTPEEGHNAALDLLQFMTNSAFVSDDEADMAEFLYTSGSGLKGENLNIEVTHPFIGHTTVNLGILNWSREVVEVIFNIRNTMGLQVDEAVKRTTAVVADFAEETGFEVSAAPRSKALNPIYVDPAEHPQFISALKEAYTVVTGKEATLHAIGGTTYSKVFPNAVCFGPVDLTEEQELAHQSDERVSVEHMLRNVKIYAYALARLCAE